MNPNILIAAGFTQNGNIFNKTMRAEDIPYFAEHIVDNELVFGTTEIQMVINTEDRTLQMSGVNETYEEGPYSIDENDGRQAMRDMGVVFED